MYKMFHSKSLRNLCFATDFSCAFCFCLYYTCCLGWSRAENADNASIPSFPYFSKFLDDILE